VGGRHFPLLLFLSSSSSSLSQSFANEGRHRTTGTADSPGGTGTDTETRPRSMVQAQLQCGRVDSLVSSETLSQPHSLDSFLRSPRPHFTCTLEPTNQPNPSPRAKIPLAPSTRPSLYPYFLLFPSSSSSTSIPCCVLPSLVCSPCRRFCQGDSALRNTLRLFCRPTNDNSTAPILSLY
jgi:hypothetical protein